MRVSLGMLWDDGVTMVALYTVFSCTCIINKWFFHLCMGVCGGISGFAEDVR